MRFTNYQHSVLFESVICGHWINSDDSLRRILLTRSLNYCFSSHYLKKTELNLPEVHLPVCVQNGIFIQE